MREQDNPLKIAFVGTSCIGKTTLLEHYRQQFIGNHNVAFVEEAARIFFQNNPHISDRFSADTQGRVQSLALENENVAHVTGAEIILCDRSVIDAVAYVRAHGDAEGANKLLEKVRFWLPTYHNFLLLDPTDVPYETDEVRKEDEQKRQKFHNAFIQFFEETQIPY